MPNDVIHNEAQEQVQEPSQAQEQAQEQPTEQTEQQEQLGQMTPEQRARRDELLAQIEALQAKMQLNSTAQRAEIHGYLLQSLELLKRSLQFLS